jgi:hypothetical protein
MNRSCLPIAQAAACAALLAALCGVAHSQTLAFGGSGFVAPQGDPVDNIQSLLATSDTGYTLGSESGWGLYAPFDFNLATGLGEGTFSFNRGSDRLLGELDTRLIAGSSTAFELVYTVYGGTGRFAGWTGTGRSMVSLVGPPGSNGFPYLESGQLTLVPEPATWALLFAGLGLVAVRSRFCV